MFGGNSNYLFILILIGLPIILIFVWIRKKKKGTYESNTIKKRRDGDEVWKTIKDYLKSKNEFGKEIVESYVAKRPNLKAIDKSLPKEEQKRLRDELKKIEKSNKEKEKKVKKSGKKSKQKKEKEIYVVLFVSRNPKNLQEDPPRAIECEVTNIRISKKENERKIRVVKDCDYLTESKWILPIKEAEEAKLRKEASKKKNKKSKPNNNKNKQKKDKKDKWMKKETIVKK